MSSKRRRSGSAGGAVVEAEKPVVDAVVVETLSDPDPEPAAEAVVVEAVPVVELVALEAPVAAAGVALQPTGRNRRSVAISVVVAFIVLDVLAIAAVLAGMYFHVL